jgi:hypothetical protein
MRSALRRAQFPLAGELLRFVLPPGDVDSLQGGGGSAAADRDDAAAVGTSGGRSPFESREAQKRAAGEAGRDPAGAGAAASGGGSSWFSWLWGGGDWESGGRRSSSGEGQGAELKAGQGAGALLAERRGRQQLSVSTSLPRGLRDTPPTSPRRAGAGAGAGPHSRPRLLQSMGSDGAAPASDARALVADAAWGLLEAGRLAQLVQVGRQPPHQALTALSLPLSRSPYCCLALVVVFAPPAAGREGGRPGCLHLALSPIHPCVLSCPPSACPPPPQWGLHVWWVPQGAHLRLDRDCKGNRRPRGRNL